VLIFRHKNRGDILKKTLYIYLLTLILSSLLISCSNKFYELELISSDVELTDTPSMVNSDVPSGVDAQLPDYYLEYTFIIKNKGSNIGGINEELNLVFEPNDALLNLLSEDIFYNNSNNGSSGPMSLERDNEGEFVLVFGLKPETLNKIDENNMEELMQGSLILKEGQKKIKSFNLRD